MEIKQYQQAVKRTVPTNLGQNDKLANFSMGLAGETGELVDLIKKHLYQNHPLNIEKVKEELGDIGWYLCNLASILDLEFSDILESNIVKLLKRYPNGFDANRSINR